MHPLDMTLYTGAYVREGCREDLCPSIHAAAWVVLAVAVKESHELFSKQMLLDFLSPDE